MTPVWYVAHCCSKSCGQVFACLTARSFAVALLPGCYTIYFCSHVSGMALPGFVVHMLSYSVGMRSCSSAPPDVRSPCARQAMHAGQPLLIEGIRKSPMP